MLGLQYISQARLNQAPPDTTDVHIQAAIVATEFPVQHHPIKIRLGQHLTALGHQLPQQPELQGCQVQAYLAGSRQLLRPIKAQHTNRQTLRLSLARASRTHTAQHRINAQLQLFQAVGLGEVVVSTVSQAANTLLFRVGRRDHNDRHAAVLPQPLEQAKPIETRQLGIQQQQVMLIAHGQLKAGIAIATALYCVAGVLQQLPQLLTELRIIFDNQYASERRQHV